MCTDRIITADKYAVLPKAKTMVRSRGLAYGFRMARFSQRADRRSPNQNRHGSANQEMNEYRCPGSLPDTARSYAASKGPSTCRLDCCVPSKGQLASAGRKNRSTFLQSVVMTALG